MGISKAPDHKFHCVSSITPLGVADKAGIKKGDVILEVNGIATSQSQKEVVKVITAQKTVGPPPLTTSMPYPPTSHHFSPLLSQHARNVSSLIVDLHLACNQLVDYPDRHPLLSVLSVHRRV